MMGMIASQSIMPIRTAWTDDWRVSGLVTVGTAGLLGGDLRGQGAGRCGILCQLQTLL